MSEAVTAIRSSRNALELEVRKLGKIIKGKMCQCPVHDDEHASASIHQGDDGAWRIKCFSCGFCGDVFDLRAKLRGVDVAEVLREASGREDAPAKPKRVFSTVDAVLASVASMGKVEAHYLYANPETGKPEVLQVRYRDEDRKKFLTHHTVEGGFALGAPQKPWPLYNRARLRAAGTVVVGEGEKVVHALHDIGIVATTSLSGSQNADKADWSPLAGKIVYVWPDNDEAGAKYGREVIAKLEALSPRPEIWLLAVEGLNLGDGGDAADMIEAGATAEEIWAVLRDGSEQIGSGVELVKRIEDVIAGEWRSLPWPWAKLSEYAKSLFPGTITVLCGDPSASKSFMLLQAAEWWLSQGIRCAMLELELGRATHLQRLLAMLAGKWDVLDDEWCRNNPGDLLKLHEQHKPTIDALSPSIFARPAGRVGYPHVLEWIKARCEQGAQIVVVDPITAIDTGDSRFADDHRFVSEASELVGQYGTRLILVTHPRGGAKGKAGIGLDDLAGGRAFGRHTQTVMILSRLDPPKAVLCRTDLGQAEIECNRVLYIPKSTHGKGTGRRFGFVFGESVRFAEQGIMMKKKDEVVR